MSGTSGFLEAVFPGDSQMARMMRATDWSATSLGNPDEWPDALKIPLRMLLTSRFEMWLGWGPDLTFFYNDAYIPTLGVKHPSSLGQPFREVWREVYADVAAQVEQVAAGGSTWNEALLLLLERSGYPEETYHSFSYSPLHDASGAVAGLLCVVSEETERVINERRMAMLRLLGGGMVGLLHHDGGTAFGADHCAVLRQQHLCLGLGDLHLHAGSFHRLSAGRHLFPLQSQCPAPVRHPDRIRTFHASDALYRHMAS